MKRFAVIFLGLLLFIAGCGKKKEEEKLLVWGIEMPDSTTIMAVCIEISEDFSERKINRNLCKDVEFPRQPAGWFVSEFSHCNALPNYVWRDCNPETLKLLQLQGSELPKKE